MGEGVDVGAGLAVTPSAVPVARGGVVGMGCQVAYNLDGGGSATMVLNGERVNRSSGSRERDVSDIIYLTAQ